MLFGSVVAMALTFILIAVVFTTDAVRVRHLKKRVEDASPVFPVKAEIENAERVFHERADEAQKIAHDTRVITEDERAELVEEHRRTAHISDTQLLKAVVEKADKVTQLSRRREGA